MYPLLDGQRLNLRGRQRCLDCRPLQRRPNQKRTPRVPVFETCDWCGRSFPARAMVEGKVRSLYRRRFCLECSPFGIHNTSKEPPGTSDLTEIRRHRRTATVRRSLNKRRRRRKEDLVALFGAACMDCGYAKCMTALEFHHRDPGTKDFTLADFNGSIERLKLEATKCDLLCANCHRLRHVAWDQGKTTKSDPVNEQRRQTKVQAVEYMGSTCFSCERDGPPALFEFHHWDARQKEFGVSQAGAHHSWKRVIGELEKCVMLCANCHREVHAGVRRINDTLLGLAEDALPYAA